MILLLKREINKLHLYSIYNYIVFTTVLLSTFLFRGKLDFEGAGSGSVYKSKTSCWYRSIIKWFFIVPGSLTITWQAISRPSWTDYVLMIALSLFWRHNLVKNLVTWDTSLGRCPTVNPFVDTVLIANISNAFFCCFCYSKFLIIMEASYCCSEDKNFLGTAHVVNFANINKSFIYNNPITVMKCLLSKFCYEIAQN